MALGTYSCSDAVKNKEPLTTQKEQLGQYKQDLKELKSKIRTLEVEIAKQDPDFLDNINVTLVSVKTVETGTFEHKIEVRGAVESRKNVLIGAEIPGRIERLPVKEGQSVRKGEALIYLNDDVLQNSIAELKTSLELAEIVYRRRENLWKQNIGSEIQYLEAKHSKESLQRRLATTHSELSKTVIKAPFQGNIEDLPVKEGEMAQPGMPLVRLISLDDMYITADVSEFHIGKFNLGDSVEVNFPAYNLNLNSTISAIGQVIKKENRTFTMEVRLPPNSGKYKPNQVVILNIKDYNNSNAMIVPARLIQKDDQGDYLYLAEEGEEGFFAKKVHVEAGVSYKNRTEIIGGLDGVEKIIHKGFREVSDGLKIQIAQEQGSLDFADNSNELSNATF